MQSINGFEMNIFEFLDEYDVEYWTSGENVTRGWVNIKCPFCEDHKNHLGIKIKTLQVNCWLCGSHTTLRFIQKIVRCKWDEAKRILRSLEKDRDYKRGHRFTTESRPSDIIKIKDIASSHFPKLHIDYLRDRGFTRPRQLIKKYRLLSCYTIGKYKYRIIIPIYINNAMISFTSRDVTEQQEPKYKHPSLDEVVMSPKKVPYNYDSIITGGDCIVVEGPVDVWKLGDCTTSLQGITFTTEQVVHLSKKNINNLFIWFDNEGKAQRKAKELAMIMAPLVNKIENIKVRGVNDPGELSISDAISIKRKLGFKG